MCHVDGQVSSIRQMLAKTILNEDGAVAVDWVVLTAGVVGLAASVHVFINPTTVNGNGQTIESGFASAVGQSLSASVGTD
jgi:hypothetical protein